MRPLGFTLALLLVSWSPPGSACVATAYPDEAETRPLVRAIERCDAAAVETLLRDGADANDFGATPLAPMHFAAAANAVGIMASLIAHGAPVDVRDTRDRQQTPLLYAIDAGRVEAARFLLQHGADVEVNAERDYSPLNLAAGLQEPRPELLAVLIDAGADVDRGTPGDGTTPLMSAVGAGATASVRVLLEHGADPNLRTEAGATALHDATYDGDLDLVRLLVQHGASASLRDREGRLPEDLARENGHRDVAAFLAKARRQD